MTVLSVLYLLTYSLVLTLLAFDLVMSMEPPWYSTLFGAYAFAKAFYLGLLALLVLAGLCHLAWKEESGLTSAHFHDVGKLLFAFCLVWAVLLVRLRRTPLPVAAPQAEATPGTAAP